jgi:SHS2 domain-containing protein
MILEGCMGYRWVDHTAELELHIAARTEAGVFEEALRAFGELIGDEATGAHETFDVDATSPDRATLLVRWLDELVYRAETEDLVPEEVERLELSADRLVAKVRGFRGEPRHLVKGVTYNGLAFDGGDDGYHATVVLDV